MYYIRTLRITTTAVYFIAIFIATTKGGIIWGLGVGIAGLLAWYPLRDHIRSWEYRETLKVYARMIENIIVKSEGRQDKGVIVRAKQELKLLKESKNKEYLQGNLKVHSFFYQENALVENMIDIKDSPHVSIKCHLVQCPTYDQFLMIVDEWREKDKAKQYENIAKEDGVWFIHNALEQE